MSAVRYTHQVAGLFDNSREAEQAIEALLDAGLEEVCLQLLGPAKPAAAAMTASEAAAPGQTLWQRGIGPTAQTALAEGLDFCQGRPGAALVIAAPVTAAQVARCQGADLYPPVTIYSRQQLNLPAAQFHSQLLEALAAGHYAVVTLTCDRNQASLIRKLLVGAMTQQVTRA